MNFENQFQTRSEGKHVIVTGPALKALELTESYREKHKVFNAVLELSDDFCGGSLEQLRADLARGKDLSQHNIAMDNFRRSGLGKKIESIRADFATRRRLRTSDVDGDWQYARRFEPKPFTISKKEKVSTKVVDLMLRLNGVAGVSAKSIDRFGVFCWSVVNLLESSGKRVRLRVISEARSSYRNGQDSRVILDVKRADEYLEPSRLAAVISANFFRRAIFGLRAYGGFVEEAGPTEGMGASYQRPAIEYSDDGALILSPDVVNGHDEQLENELLKLLS